MGGNGKYYDVEGYESWKKSRGKAIIPPRANFLAAVFYIRNLLDGKKFTWAATGSLAMLCLGARREIPDVHIVYDDRDFIRLKGKLETDQRTRLPTSMNTLFPSKLLISTGPKYKDSGCTENVDIEVNLLPPGSHGAPANDILRSNMVLLSLKSEGKDTGVKGLNILYLVRTMLAFYKIRELSWDPRRDVLFLCQHYGREIESVRGQLVQRDVQENFLGTSFFAKLTPEDQRLCYQVLLGKEPPPKMSLTPAPTQLSSSAPESARPRIPSHNSSPSLNTAMQQQSALLTPPKPGKKTKARPSTAGSAAPSSQAQVPAPAPAPVPGKPLSQVPPTSTTTSRDTRSRYRSVNSAPNTPSASRNVSPDAPSSIASRPKSMANNMSAQQPAAPSLKSQSVSLQNIPNAAKPRVDPMHPPNPNPTQTRKSMPNLQAGPTGKVPVYAHTQQVQGMPQGAPLPPQGYQFQGFSPALAMGPAQSAQIPGVPPFPHQGFAGPVESTHIGPAHHAQFHPTPPIPQQGFSGQIEYGSVGPAHQAQFHPAPPIPQQNFTSQFQPGPPGPTYNGHINANPIPPQARGRHHVPKPAANPIGHPEEKLRRVVGHDGVYGAPAKQAPAKPTPKFPEHQSTKTYGSPSLSSFVFELDAGPSEPIKPFIPQPSGFIAELPAVDVSPINWPVEPQTGTLAAPAALKQPEHDVSSIAPPKTMQTTPAVIAASASTASSTHLPGSTFPPHAVSAPVPVPIPANARISTYLPPHIPTATSHSAPVPTSHLVSAYVHPEPAIVPPPAPASSSVPSYAPPAIPTVEPTPGPVTNLPTPPTEVPEPPQTTIHPSLLEALPASLMIGGPVCPRRSPNNSLSGPSTHSSNVATNSNAQIYQRYYSPPSSTPSSTQPSPRQDPVYKAYSRPISPPAIGAGLSNSHSAPHVSHGQGTYPISQSMPLGRTVDPLTPQTPADMLGLSLSEAPKPNYEHVNDACKPQAQAHPIHNSFAPQQPPEFFNPFASYEPGHKRSASHESQASNASHDSTKLAAEYQQELPDFDNGYSSKAAAAPVANYTGAGYGRRDSMDFT